MRFRFAFFVLVAAVWPFPAEAGVSIDTVTEVVHATDKPIRSVTVRNTDAENPVGVDVVVLKVTNAGMPNETREPSTDIAVAPGKFDLAGGASRAVRLVVRKRPQDSEAVYRIRFMPTSEFADQVSRQQSGNVTTEVRIQIAMGMLLFVRPPSIVSDISAQRPTADLARFANKGNTTIELHRGEVCGLSSGQCAEFSGKRLYPGMTWDLDVPASLGAEPFQLTVVNGQGTYEDLQVPSP